MSTVCDSVLSIRMNKLISNQSPVCDIGESGYRAMLIIFLIMYIPPLIYLILTFTLKTVNRYKRANNNNNGTNPNKFTLNTSDLLYIINIIVLIAAIVWNSIDLYTGLTEWHQFGLIWLAFSHGIYVLLFIRTWCVIVRDPTNPKNSLMKTNPKAYYGFVAFAFCAHMFPPVVDSIKRPLALGQDYFLLNLFLDSSVVCGYGFYTIMMYVLRLALTDLQRLKGNTLADQLISRGSLLLYQMIPSMYIGLTALLILENLYPYNAYTIIRIFFIVIPLHDAGSSILLLSIDNRAVFGGNSNNSTNSTTNYKSTIKSSNTAISSNTSNNNNNTEIISVKPNKSTVTAAAAATGNQIVDIESPPAN